MPKEKFEYDLEERTTRFGEAIMKFAKEIPANHVTIPVISQFVRSGTSIGANYCEAINAESKKDFHHSIARCKKEAKETMYWMRIVVVAEPAGKNKARQLWKEAHELLLIFSAINRKK